MMCGRYVQYMGTCPVVTLQFHRDPSQGRPRVWYACRCIGGISLWLTSIRTVGLDACGFYLDKTRVAPPA
jgi:hypothetical protein